MSDNTTYICFTDVHFRNRYTTVSWMYVDRR